MSSLPEFLSAMLTAYAADLRSEQRAPSAEPRDYIYASRVRSCTRRMALDLLHPDEEEPFSDDALARMKRGKEREKALHIRLLQISDRCAMPFEVIEAQKKIFLHGRGGRLVIVGDLDALIKLRDNGHSRYTCEIKSGQMADNISTLADMDRSEYTRGWVDQHLAYQLGLGIGEGFFLLDRPGMPAPIPIMLEDDDHLQRAERFLQKAEHAVAARFGETDLPEMTENLSLCERCPHRGRSCLPPISNDPAAIITDPELIAIAEIHEETIGPSREYVVAHKVLAKALRGIMLGALGPFEVRGKWKARRVCDLPPEVATQIEKLQEPFERTLEQGAYEFVLERLGESEER